MHVSRQRIISNRSLLQRAREADVPQYIQSKQFNPKLWIPYNYKVAKHFDTVPLVAAAPEVMNLVPTARKRSADEMLESDEPEVAIEVEESLASAEGVDPLIGDQDGLKTVETSRIRPQRQFKRGKEDFRVQWLGDKARSSFAAVLSGCSYTSSRLWPM